MPSGHRPGNFKQKNKPFKGGSGKSKAHKVPKMPGVTKKIQKAEKPLSKLERKNRVEQLRGIKESEDDRNLELNIKYNQNLNAGDKEIIQELIKNFRVPKTVVLLPFNEAADALRIKQDIEKFIASHIESEMKEMQETRGINTYKFPYYNLSTDPKIFPELGKSNYIIVNAPSDLESKLDLCKTADIICPILSCKNCNVERITVDPFENAKAFDEAGYKLLSCLRILGMPKTVGILQDLELISDKKKSQVRKLFQRFFESELGQEEKMVNIDGEKSSILNFLRTVSGVNETKMSWRENRGYLLADKITILDDKRIEVSGFLKGSSLNANQLIHITGYDDYQIEKIEVLKNPFKPFQKKKKQGKDEVMDFNKEVLLTQIPDPDKIENLQSLARNPTDIMEKKEKFSLNIIDGGKAEKEMEEEEGMNEEEGLEEEKMQEIKSKKPVKNQHDLDEEDEKMEDEEDFDKNYDNQSDVSFDEDQDLEIDKKREKFELRERVKEELDFPDEVDYTADTNLRDKFKKYKGLKNMKSSDWNLYDDLPEDYDCVYVFSDIGYIKKKSIHQTTISAFAYKGAYLRITIINFPIQLLSSHPPERPFIVSSLFPHERKVSQMHVRIKKHHEFTGNVKSKEPINIHLGFRKINTAPIYSKIFQNCKRTKYEHELGDNGLYLCSFYYHSIFPPANALLFKSGELCAQGELLKIDAMHLILKRIMFTGYPYKIHKKKAVVRMMFFNPKDVKYFQPVELSTKNGLRGHILESLGTHGYMKCGFSGFIKGSDIITLSLYKRVFPKLKL